MRSIGQGASVWRVRVDLYAPDTAAARVDACGKSLVTLLVDDGAVTVPCETGVDGGTGIAGRPVIDLTFWVRSDDVGGAATTAVKTAIEACARAGVGPDLYDVTVIPQDAVAVRAWVDANHYPPMPD